MFTHKRLDEAFRDAFPVPFDDTSKFVFLVMFIEVMTAYPMSSEETAISMTMR
jgi:hypothetical protein